MDPKEEYDYEDDRSHSGGEENDRDRDRERDRDRARRGERRRVDRPKGAGRRAPAERRIYVSNIPYEYKWQDLKDLFRSEVGEVSYVEMFNDENNRPRGCAIIEFESPELVQKAIDSMHRYELKGRMLVVKEDFDTERDKHGRIVKGGEMGHRGGGGGGGVGVGVGSGRSGGFSMRGGDLGLSGGAGVKYGNTYGLSTVFLESLGITGPLINKVFVANLDYKVEDKMLREVFKIAGKVTSVEISKDQDGKSRGFGIVEFEHPVEAVQAISMLHNQVYYDRIISVRMDRVSEKKEASSSKLPPGLKGLGMGLGANGAPLIDVATCGKLGSIIEGDRRLTAADTGLMKRLPATPASLNATVSGLGGMNNVGMGNTGVGMGQMGAGMGGLANMDNAMGNMAGAGGMGLNNMNAGMVGGLAGMAAAAASNTSMGGMNTGGGGAGGMGMGGMGGMGMAANNAMGGGGSLVGMGNMGSGGSSLGGGSNMIRGIASSMGSGLNSSGNSYGGYGSSSNGGLSRDYNHSSYSSSNQRSVVHINNLPLDYNWQSLRDLCREFGDIRFAEIRGKGMGTVRFQHESDARRAVEMLDRQRMEGRILDVCMA